MAERWCEAEIHRIAGEIALISTDSDATKTEAYFEPALTVAREQQAKSWELRAAMSVARRWRDQRDRIRRGFGRAARRTFSTRRRRHHSPSKSLAAASELRPSPTRPS